MTSFLAAYSTVHEITTKDDLLTRVVRFAHGLGFQTVTATAVRDGADGRSEFSWVENSPPAFKEIGSNPVAAQRDPVMQHCKRSSVPIAWNQSTYVHAGEGGMWEEQARFGYRSGICLAMHLQHGLHFSIGVDREDALPSQATEITRLTAELALFAMCIQEVAMRLLLRTSESADAMPLTARELETLHWTMEGKTAWEIGRILGIAENTVIRHASSATHKLGCTSKHHAVVKALRLGLMA